MVYFLGKEQQSRAHMHVCNYLCHSARDGTIVLTLSLEFGRVASYDST